MELSAKHASGEALSLEASKEISRAARRLPPCSDVSVLQKTRMSHFLGHAPYLRGLHNRAHRRVLRSCQPSTRRERLFP